MVVYMANLETCKDCNSRGIQVNAIRWHIYQKTKHGWEPTEWRPLNILSTAETYGWTEVPNEILS